MVSLLLLMLSVMLFTVYLSRLCVSASLPPSPLCFFICFYGFFCKLLEYFLSVLSQDVFLRFFHAAFMKTNLLLSDLLIFFFLKKG